MLFDRISILCFGASYAVALVLEMLGLAWPRPVLKMLGLGFGLAGLLAHTLYLIFHPPSLGSQFGSLLFLAWILSVFYLYGSMHHRRLAWGVFVLPVVVGLIALAGVTESDQLTETSWLTALDAVKGERFWGIVHGILLLLAAVGVCVGFIASLMYLFQAQRLKAKIPPGQGLRLPSLERLEAMNRHAVNLAFPLLSAGVLVGLVLMWQRGDQLQNWLDPKIWGAEILWAVFAIMLYLRYGFHLRGRRVALLTIMAFGLLVFTLASAHTVLPGGGR
jgi:ABC-type transport system involved in cytochrome c biogenesis permease subunit